MAELSKPMHASIKSYIDCCDPSIQGAPPRRDLGYLRSTICMCIQLCKIQQMNNFFSLRIHQYWPWNELSQVAYA